MPQSQQQSVGVRIPQGYGVVPVTVEQTGVPLRISVLVRRQPDPVAGHFVVLRDAVDARVLLGAVTDAQQRVHHWLEVWIQSLEGLSNAVSAYVESMTNDLLDRRWEAQAQWFNQLDQDPIVHTGWETTHPPPIFLDLQSMQPVHPQDPESREAWRLCLEDAVLESKGLPRYSTSLHRYLYLPALGEDSPFVPVTTDAPTNGSCQPMSQVAQGPSGLLLGLNPGGGLMMARPYYPLGFEPFVDLLSGDQWGGLSHGRTMVDLGLGPNLPQASKQSDQQRLSDGWLFMGSCGRWGRLIETVHLKLRLIADAVEAVRAMTQATGRPIFNLTPDSFQITLGQLSDTLPFFWTAKPILVDPGTAVALPIQSSDLDYYLPGKTTTTSIYYPQSVGLMVRGKGLLRIRETLDASGGLITLEGTLSTQDQIDPSPHDLAWIRLNVASGRVDLYAYLDRESAMAVGEWRFRTVNQRLSPAAQDALREAEGVPMHDTPFEVAPLLSSPCDLYSLGVLAVRTLLVDKEAKLSVALDEVLSLARQVADQGDPSLGLSARIQAAFAQDDRWLPSLGPHRLSQEAIEPQDAFDVVPSQLWWEVLAMVVRLFPGIAPDCHCSGFGDATAGGIHKVFDPALEDLHALLRRTRSLIVIDWRFNREVHAVIRRHRSGLDPS